MLLASVSELAVSLDTFGDSQFGLAVQYTFFNVTATPVGGVPPYSYAWDYLTPNNGSWSVIGSGATVAARVGSVVAGSTATAILRCTVTDAAGSPAIATATYSYERSA